MEGDNKLQHLTSGVETCLLSLEKDFGINPNVGMVLLGVMSIEGVASKLNVEDWVTLAQVGDRAVINKLLKFIANNIDDHVILLSLQYNAPEGSDVHKLASVKLRNMAVGCEFQAVGGVSELHKQIGKLKKAMHGSIIGTLGPVADKLLYDLTFEVDDFTDEQKIKAYGSVEAFDAAHPKKIKHDVSTFEGRYNKLADDPGGLRPRRQKDKPLFPIGEGDDD